MLNSLNTFSYAYWPYLTSSFVRVICKSLALLLIFKLGCLSVLLLSVEFLNSLEMRPVPDIHVLLIFSPGQGFAFSLS